MKSINGFQGEYRFLSNFWECPVRYKGYTFTCSEAAYMAEKSGLESDLERFSKYDARTAKKEGRKVKLRDNWDVIKDHIMEDVVYNKFSQNPILKKKLLETGDAYLEETNTWNDTYWGVCNGKGNNGLGKILMQVRSELRGL